MDGRAPAQPEVPHASRAASELWARSPVGISPDSHPPPRVIMFARNTSKPIASIRSSRCHHQRPAPPRARSGASRDAGPWASAGPRVAGVVLDRPGVVPIRRVEAPEDMISRGLLAPLFLRDRLHDLRQNAGRSSGFRDVIRLPSTTTSWSSPGGPGVHQIVLDREKLVARLPLRMPADTGTQPAWQIAAHDLALARKASRTSFTMAGDRA